MIIWKNSNNSIFSNGYIISKIDSVIVAKRKMIAFTVKDCVLKRSIEKIANRPNPIPTPISIFVKRQQSEKVQSPTITINGFMVALSFLLEKKYKTKIEKNNSRNLPKSSRKSIGQNKLVTQM